MAICWATGWISTAKGTLVVTPVGLSPASTSSSAIVPELPSAPTLVLRAAATTRGSRDARGRSGYGICGFRNAGRGQWAVGGAQQAPL